MYVYMYVYIYIHTYISPGEADPPIGSQAMGPASDHATARSPWSQRGCGGARCDRVLLVGVFSWFYGDDNGIMMG